MLEATILSSKNELEQIYALSRQNLKQKLDPEEKASQGFVTWLYSLQLLEQMQELAPAIIVKDEDKVVAYALTTLKEAKSFHPDLDVMFHNLDPVLYKGRALSTHHFYCMGQICVAKEYRGQGLVNLLYQKHKERYSNEFDFVLTEISTSNSRSLRAHEKIGFKTIYSYSDALDEWNVVVWDWDRH